MNMLFNVHLVCVRVRMMCDVPGLYSCARGDGFPVSFATMVRRMKTSVVDDFSETLW